LVWEQGPIEHIWISEVSLGRTKSATKLVKGVAKAWSTYKPRLPLTVRGVRIELREGEDVPPWAVRGPKKEARAPSKPAKAAAAGNDAEDKGKSVSRGLFIALAARLAFVALPVLPVRVKNVSFAHKVALLNLPPPLEACSISLIPVACLTRILP
jgi:hypothetical protein